MNGGWLSRMLRKEHASDGAQALTRTDRFVIATAIALIVALAIQPAFVDRDPNRQSDFAWEMYSKGGPRDEFGVVSADGMETLSVRDIQPRAPATVDYTAVLPTFICERRSDAIEVAVYQADALLGVYQCDR